MRPADIKSKPEKIRKEKRCSNGQWDWDSNKWEDGGFLIFRTLKYFNLKSIFLYCWSEKGITVISYKAVWYGIQMVEITAVFNVWPFSQVAEPLSLFPDVPALTWRALMRTTLGSLGCMLNWVPNLPEKVLSLFSFPFVLLTCDIISWHLFL